MCVYIYIGRYIYIKLRSFNGESVIMSSPLFLNHLDINMNQFQVHWLLESCAHNDTKGLGKVTELTYVSLH